MSFDIEELKIKFFTNIKSKEKRIIEFNLSMLHHPELDKISEDLNQYPYFTFDVRYPLSRLRYLTYNERVEFFFNREKFSERLTAYSKEKNILDKTKITSEGEQKEYYDKRHKNIEKNIMTMIEILFPTKFPVINDIHTTLDIVFGESKLKRMILNPIITKYYSYLKLDDGIYTFKKTIWMNDILNHPLYRDLIEKYRKFFVWSIEEKSKQMITMNKTYGKIVKMINEFSSNLETGQNNDFYSKIKNSLPTTENEYKYDDKDMWKQNLPKTIQGYDKMIEILSILEKELENKEKNQENKNKLDLLTNETFVQFKKAVVKYIQTESLFYKTYDEVSKVSSDLAPEYRNFSYGILSSYRKPSSESTNTELQELINGSNNESTNEFYKFMEYLYNKYIFLGGGKPPPDNNEYRKLMDVGLRYLTTNVTEGARREIYVYADFIKGEVNKDNVKKIFCPYVGDHLGNEFEFLVRMLMYGKVGSKDTKKWEISRNRMIFSIKESKSDGATGETGQQLELESKPLEPTKEERQLNIPGEEKRVHLDRLSSFFISDILSKGLNIKKQMDQVNKYSRDEQLFDQNLLDHIKKNDQELNGFIEEWNENLQNRNQKLLEKMLKQKGKYDGDITAIESTKNTWAVRGDQNKLNRLNYEIELKKLYLSVLTRLIESETSKGEVIAVRGGSRKYKKRSNCRRTRRR